MKEGVVWSISVAFKLESIKESLELLNELGAEVNNGIIKLPSVPKTSPSENEQQFVRLMLRSGWKQRVHELRNSGLVVDRHCKLFHAARRVSIKAVRSDCEVNTEVEMRMQFRASFTERPIACST